MQEKNRIDFEDLSWQDLAMTNKDTAHLMSLPQVVDVTRTESTNEYEPERVVVTFANGYSASVIRGQYTYGGRDGLWEVAVVNPEGQLDYTTPITSDVIGHLHSEELPELLIRIADL